MLFDTSRLRKEVSIGPQTASASLLEGSVADYGPLTLGPVGMGSDFKLWNEYVHRYHNNAAIWAKIAHVFVTWEAFAFFFPMLYDHGQRLPR